MWCFQSFMMTFEDRVILIFHSMYAYIKTAKTMQTQTNIYMSLEIITYKDYICNNYKYFLAKYLLPFFYICHAKQYYS